jgi:hypothetical protein
LGRRQIPTLGLKMKEILLLNSLHALHYMKLTRKFFVRSIVSVR